MIHVTAAIGLGLGALIEAIFWSVAPSAGVIIAGLGLLVLAAMALLRRRRRRS